MFNMHHVNWYRPSVIGRFEHVVGVLSRLDKNDKLYIYIPIDERRRRGVTQLKTRSDDPFLDGHHPRASRTLVHSGSSYYLVTLVLGLRWADRHPVAAWLDHRVRDDPHCSSREFSPFFRGMSRELIISSRSPRRGLTRFANKLQRRHSLLFLCSASAEGITLERIRSTGIQRI